MRIITSCTRTALVYQVIIITLYYWTFELKGQIGAHTRTPMDAGELRESCINRMRDESPKKGTSRGKAGLTLTTTLFLCTYVRGVPRMLLIDIDASTSVLQQ